MNHRRISRRVLTLRNSYYAAGFFALTTGTSQATYNVAMLGVVVVVCVTVLVFRSPDNKKAAAAKVKEQKESKRKAKEQPSVQKFFSSTMSDLTIGGGPH